MSTRAAVAGDFLALLAQQAPAGTGVKPAAPAAGAWETHGTTVFAFHCAEGVMMVGDRRATAGSTIISDQIEKVLEIDASSVLAIAGAPATAFEMARVLQTSFEYYRRSQLQALSLAAKVRALARLLRENLPMAMQGVGLVVPLFAGLDTSATPPSPQIFFYDAMGAQFQAVSHAASGSGAVTIRSILSYQERYGDPTPTKMARGKAVQFALRVLKVAAEFDAATGGVDPGAATFATVKLLTSAGVRTVPVEEQGEAWRL